jgi:hypothetical protein
VLSAQCPVERVVIVPCSSSGTAQCSKLKARRLLPFHLSAAHRLKSSPLTVYSLQRTASSSVTVHDSRFLIHDSSRLKPRS